MNAHSRDKYITVEMMTHKKTGLIIATSKQLRGLIVHGRTLEEINARLPIAIKDLFEAEGQKVARVEKVEEAVGALDAFLPNHMKFELREAA